MENTYTYTARSLDHPERVVTFTLHDRRMSVGVGVPLEQAVRFAESAQQQEAGDEGEATAQLEHARPQLWLKPFAVSLVEQGTAPFRVVDVDVHTDGDWLLVRGWMRVGGLRLAPITLMSGRVDNADAAHAFAEEVVRRKEALSTAPPILQLLDYWATWMVFTSVMVTLFTFWRTKRYDEEDSA